MIDNRIGIYSWVIVSFLPTGKLANREIAESNEMKINGATPNLVI